MADGLDIPKLEIPMVNSKVHFPFSRLTTQNCVCMNNIGYAYYVIHGV